MSLHAPAAHPGAPARERGCEAYSLERTSHFADYFDALFEACKAQGIPVCGHCARGRAIRSTRSISCRASRSRRPMPCSASSGSRARSLPRVRLPGDLRAQALPRPARHRHALALQPASRRRSRATAIPRDYTNAFAHPDGRERDALGAFIGGLQRHADAAMAFFAPHDMAFDRIAMSDASPSSASWGHDDRAVAFRIPQSSAQNRRVENRLPGGDANPYLSVAATLGLGLAGIEQGLAPGRRSRQASRCRARWSAACDALERSALMRELFGDPLVDLFVALKRHESAERNAAPIRAITGISSTSSNWPEGTAAARRCPPDLSTRRQSVHREHPCSVPPRSTSTPTTPPRRATCKSRGRRSTSTWTRTSASSAPASSACTRRSSSRRPASAW